MRYGGGKRGELTPACKRALVVMLEDNLIRINSGWKGESGKLVRQETIEALYDRYLVKIVIDSRHRKRHTAKLTEVGEFAAREIERQFLMVSRSAPPHKISEQAARFIAEVVG